MKLSEKKLFLFDIDGTLAVGDELLPESRELLADIEARGGKSYFITNNSTRSQEDYVKRFRAVFGLDTTPDQFATSSFVSALALRELLGGAPVFVVGTDSLLAELRRFGVNAVNERRDDLAAILVGYDSSLTYEKLCTASELLQTTDLPWYATNPDLRCPAPFGFIPDCGAICDMLTATTDRKPIYFGKPAREMVDLCILQSGFSPEETLVVGDRLYTDIACGIHAGVDTCLLLTGEAKMEDLRMTRYRPTYCFETVADLRRACRY